ncbi:uncharacterized protein LOC112056719 [Bicyclus anynana]|uniref:Uncharacterized protein LOC112056719 n=1 Tax=Bicyclus anynana TaxID=110368 RepID=A0A6J1P583_BICAN|nr:uncharacterized protein LOC112056719 [Bicyclus anynana]
MGDVKSAASVKKNHSHYSFSSGQTNSHVICKSDANVCYTSKTQSASYIGSKGTNSVSNKEYYKNYEHDEIPVKDDSSFNDHSFSEDNNSTSRDHKDSLTNSDLDKLEMNIFSKMSQELQTDDEVSSLDSNIKLFKSTVQQIFDNFYTNMNDFELYKKKFKEILEKNKGESFTEMEDFIKDMIHSIGSSNSVSDKEIPENQQISDQAVVKSSKVNVEDSKKSDKEVSDMDSFLNNNYLTDSTFDDNSSKFNPDVKPKDTIFTVDLASYIESVEFNVANRKMLSEINIRAKNIGITENQVASAENIQKITAKKFQIENYVKLEQESRAKDREIPVKIASVKKNIHLDENFNCEIIEEESKFFLFKICNYICRKLRRS